MSLLPSLRTTYGTEIGVGLFFAFPDLSSYPKSYLEADSAVSATSLTANGLDFSANGYLIIGQPGDAKTEIAQINGTPTATTITLVSNANFAHNRGDIIRFIPYNQIEAQFSTNGTSYSIITPVAIRADASETFMARTSDLSTYYYKFRFYNSTTGLYSTISDTVIATGFADNTVWAVKEHALKQLGEVRTDLISDQFLDDSLMEARRMADQNPAIFRWTFRTKFGVTFSQMLAGQWSIPAPTDLRDRNTNKNILSLRIGNQNRPVVYQDRRRFNQNYLNVVHTTVATAYTSGATSIVLTSTHDLDSSGSITVANEAVGNGLIAIAYTGNNKTTNTLTGVTGGTRNIAVGTDMWQRGIFGLPTSYTIDNGVIYFDVPLKVDYDGMDAKGDYYRTITAIDSDADTFDEPFYDLFVFYLKFKIKYLKANGRIDRDSDTDYRDWITGLGMLIGQETPAQYVNFSPDTEGFLSSFG